MTVTLVYSRSSRTTLYPPSMLLQDIDRKELQKKGEDDSITWPTYAVENLVIIESVIQDMVQQKGKLPIQLLKMANVILETSSGINSIKNRKEDFEQLLGENSTLVVILCQLYIEGKVRYQDKLAWPPPKLRDLLDELEDTTCGIHKVMARKSEKNLAKRVLLGYFGIRDLGKVNTYQRRLGIMASYLQSKPHNINIHAVLLAVVHSRIQPQDEDSDSELAGELVEVDLPGKKSAKKKAVDKKLTAEGSRLCEVGESTSVKPANQVKSGRDSQRKSSKAKNKDKDNSKHEHDEERSAEDRPAGSKVDRRTNCNEEAGENQDRGQTIGYDSDEADLVERTSAQGSRSTNAAQWKTRKKPSQSYEDEENIRDMATISATNGSGIMINENIGNTYNLTTSG